MDFEQVPAFLLERAIVSLERLRDQVDSEISSLRGEQNARDWQRRHRQHMRKITADLIKTGITDETQARAWLQERGHSWKYAGEILSAMQTRIESQKKAAREVEIFRRWNIGKEKKTALAREFGLSRATVERICRRMSENGEGLQRTFNLAKAAKKPISGHKPRNML